MSRGCEFFSDALVDRAAGTLDTERDARLEVHLAQCPDCVDALRVVAAVRAAEPPVPEGLEARIRTAVRSAAGAADAADPRPAPGRRDWRPFALPLAAAAALVGIWIGVGMPGTGPQTSPETALAAAGELDPYGAWPAGGTFVAGEPVLSELSIEELERLLEEME